MKHEHVDETNDPRTEPRAAAFEDALKQAFRAEDPGAAFTQRVLARAREERAAQQSGRPLSAAAFGQASASVSEVSGLSSSEVSARQSSDGFGGSEVFEVSARTRSEVSAPSHAHARTRRFTATRKLIAAIAASLTFAAAGTQWLQHRRYVAEGERARAQVLAALRLTNEKLDIVQDKITEREHAR
jgi:hypothetical protein